MASGQMGRRKSTKAGNTTALSGGEMIDLMNYYINDLLGKKIPKNQLQAYQKATGSDKTVAKTEAKKSPKLKPLGPTKNIEDRRGTKSVPKTVDTKPRRKTSVESMTNEEIKRGMGSKRKAAQESGDTTPQRKKPGRFSEENAKRVMKEKFGIDVTYDKGDELDPLVARGEEPGRKKGGMVQFTKRGGMYNKPARKNSKG